MAVFLQTNPHRPDEAWHSGQRAGRIEPTSDSLALIAEALRMLRPLWVPGLRYFKAGVVLNDLVAERQQPRMLFATRDPAKSAKVMQALDAVNARYGRGTLRPLATGIARPWATRRDCRKIGGAGGDCHLRVGVVGWLELLSEAGAERAIVDGAANLEQQVGAAPRPAHLL